MNVSLINEQA
ncbi:uncharacterized protein FFNC_15721 [Fusarium fujikuroi]|nr:uncharacterized protein FFNC_15721 [Fusarium fujikuroi]